MLVMYSESYIKSFKKIVVYIIYSNIFCFKSQLNIDIDFQKNQLLHQYFLINIIHSLIKIRFTICIVRLRVNP